MVLLYMVQTTTIWPYDRRGYDDGDDDDEEDVEDEDYVVAGEGEGDMNMVIWLL